MCFFMICKLFFKKTSIYVKIVDYNLKIEKIP